MNATKYSLMKMPEYYAVIDVNIGTVSNAPTAQKQDMLSYQAKMLKLLTGIADHVNYQQKLMYRYNNIQPVPTLSVCPCVQNDPKKTPLDLMKQHYRLEKFTFRADRRFKLQHYC